MEYTSDGIGSKKPHRTEEPNETDGDLHSILTSYEAGVESRAGPKATTKPGGVGVSSLQDPLQLLLDEPDEADEILPVEQRLMNYLLRNYERSVRPVKNASDTVFVRMGLTLTQIFDMVS